MQILGPGECQNKQTTVHHSETNLGITGNKIKSIPPSSRVSSLASD